MVGGWKNKMIEKILISLIFIWLEVEKLRDGKSEIGRASCRERVCLAV